MSEITEEISKMFEEICGTPITNPKAEEHKEKLDKWKIDVLAFFKEAYGLGLPEWQRDFIKSLEREILHRSDGDKHMYRCGCGTEYEVISTGRPRLEDAWMGIQVQKYESDDWHCYRCGTPVRTVGRILRITSIDNKFTYNPVAGRKAHVASYDDYRKKREMEDWIRAKQREIMQEKYNKYGEPF